MNLKISVIMPIYNAGKYLKNTLDSIINQTIGFENIELILVDDCSTDNSRDIVEEYSSKYSNIKPIFLEENTGCPGIPRNIGIENATSDYIMFIDNDDEYLPEICNTLYNTLISENADIVVCDNIETEGNTVFTFSIDSCRVVRGKEIVYFDNVYIWNCIFKRSIILDNNISFIDGIYEDGIFTLEYYLHSKKLVYLNDFVGYNHISRKNSLSEVTFDLSIEVINSFDIFVKILNDNNCDLTRFFKPDIQGMIWRATVLGEDGNKEEIKEVLSHLYDFERKINFNGELAIVYKFINFFILHGNLNIATYICLFISKLRKFDLILNVYRKVFSNTRSKKVE